MSKFLLDILGLLLLLIPAVNSAAGDTLTVKATSYVINKDLVQYTFQLKSTNYNNVPQNSVIQLTFPSEYSGILPSQPLCQTSSTPVRNLTCTPSSTTIIITDFYQTDIFDSIFTVIITNIKNPSRTGTTGYFSGLINSPSPTNIFAASSATVFITTASASCAITTSTQVLGASSGVTFGINITNAIPVSGGFNISVPKWDQNLNSMIVSSTSYTCQVVLPNLITLTSSSCIVTIGTDSDTIAVKGISTVLLPSGTYISFYFGSLKMPPLPDQILTTDDTGRSLDSCTPSLQVSQPNVLTVDANNFLVCVTNTNIKTINTADTCVLSFTTTNPLPVGASIRITFPSEVGTTKLISASLDSPTTIGDLSIAYNLPTITITNAVPSYASQSTNFKIRMNTIVHPNTTAPTSSFSIQTMRGSDIIDTKTSGITYSASSGTLTSTAVSANPTSGGSSSSLTFTIVVGNPLSTWGLITIIFPSEFTISDGSKTCAGLSTNSQTTPACSVVSRSLTVTNILKYNIAKSDTISFRIDGVTLPTTTKPTATAFYISTGYSIYYVDILNTLIFTATTGVISASSSLQALSQPYVGLVSSYSMSITCQNPVPQGGLFYITFPSDYQITISDSNSIQSGSYLIYSLLTYPLVVTVDTTVQPAVIHFTSPVTGAIAKSSVIQIVIPGLNNPLNTGGTSSFLIETKTTDNYSIDKLTVGLGLASGSISPSDFYSASVSAGLSTTGSSTSYTFRIVPVLAHKSTDIIFIAFPSTYTLPSNMVCQVTTPSVGSTTGCPSDLSNQISIQLNQNISAQQQITIIVSSVTNPIEERTSDSFVITSKTSTNGYSIHRRSTGITFTTTSSQILIANLTRNNLAINATSVYTFSFTPINVYPSNITIELKVPSQVTIPGSFTCLGVIGYATNPSVCRVKPSTTDIIQVIGGGPYSTTSLGFSINSLQNPSVNINSDPFSLTVYSAAGFVIDQLPSSSSSNLIAVTPCDSSCATCLSSSRYACLSCYSPYKLIQSQYQCSGNCPTNTYESSGMCISCSALCKTCEGPTSLNCTSCDTTSLIPYLSSGQCVAQCPPTAYLDASKTCRTCTTPCSTCTSSTVCTGCQSGSYLYNNQCLATCPDGYYNDPSLTCKKCKTGCLTCNSLSNCTTCDQSSPFPVFRNYDCISGCPTGYFRSGQICEACESPCATCSFGATICDSCESGLFLSLGSCIACQSPCKSCSNSQTTCASCIAGFYLQETQCVSACSAGYYLDNSTLSCVKCKTPCYTCYSPTSCESCNSASLFPYFYANYCTAVCPEEAPDIQLGECVDLNKTKYYNPYSGIYISGVPFPFVIFSILGILLALVAKGISELTHVIGVCSAFLSITEMSSWIALIILGALTHPDDLLDTVYFFIAIIGILSKFATNAFYYKYSTRMVLRDEDYVEWTTEHRKNKIASWIMTGLSFYDLRVFRLMHSRFMGFKFLDADFNTMSYFRKINIFTLLHLLVVSLIMVIAAISAINYDSIYPQIRNIGIEVVIITFFEELFCIIYCFKPDHPPKILPEDPALKAITAIEKSILDKLNDKIHESLNTTRLGESTRNRTFRRRNSQPISDYEYHASEGRDGRDSSSFIGLNTSFAATKLLNSSNDDIPYVGGGIVKGTNGEEMGRVHTIEEKDKEDDDVDIKIETVERMDTTDEFLVRNMDGAHKRLEQLEKRLARLSERKTSYDSPFKPTIGNTNNFTASQTFTLTNGNSIEEDHLDPEPQTAIDLSTMNGQQFKPNKDILINDTLAPAGLKAVNENIMTSQPLLAQSDESKPVTIEDDPRPIPREELNTLQHTTSSISKEFYNAKDSDTSRSTRVNKICIIRSESKDLPDDTPYSADPQQGTHLGSRLSTPTKQVRQSIRSRSPVEKERSIYKTSIEAKKSVEPKFDIEPSARGEAPIRSKSPQSNGKVNLRKVIKDLKAANPQAYNTKITNLRRSTNPVTETLSNSRKGEDSIVGDASISPRQKSAGKTRPFEIEYQSYNGEEHFTKQMIGIEAASKNAMISINDSTGEKSLRRSVLRPRDLLKDGVTRQIVRTEGNEESEEEIELRDKRPGSKNNRKPFGKLSKETRKALQVDMGSIDSLPPANDALVNFTDDTPSAYNDINQRFIEGFKKKDRPKRESRSTIKKVSSSSKRSETSSKKLKAGISKNNFIMDDHHHSAEPNGEITIIPGKEFSDPKAHYSFQQKVKDLSYTKRSKERSDESSPDSSAYKKKDPFFTNNGSAKRDGYEVSTEFNKDKKTFETLDSERLRHTSNIQVIPSDSIDITHHSKKSNEKYKLPDKSLKLQSIGKSFDAGISEQLMTVSSKEGDGQHPIFERNDIDLTTIEKLNILDTQETEQDYQPNKYPYHNHSPNGHF